MNLLKELLLLTEARIASKEDVEKAIKIINSYATSENPFNDILIRVMGFTSGFVSPDTNKSEVIDVIPVLNELRSNGLVTMRGKNIYKRGDALGQLMRDHTLKGIESVIGGAPAASGRLSLEQIDRLAEFAVGEGNLGDRLSNAPNIWKSGGKRSGDVKSLIQQRIMNSDPNYESLSDGAKNLIPELAQLSNPEDSFQVLKYILQLSKSKKNYTSFVREVEQYFTNEKYVDALYGLVDIGVIDSANGNRINGNVINQIREIINFMSSDSIENISPIDKLNAFLPNFGASATSTSASLHRGVNELLKDKSFVNIVINRLTDEIYDDILDTPTNELSGVKLKVKQIADAFELTDLNEFRNKVNSLIRNRANHKGDENIAAKDEGRFNEFVRKFSI